MEIKEAVKMVMEKEGAKIISSPNFTKRLPLRKVLINHPEYARIIKSMQSLGFDDRILNLESDEKELGIYALSDLFADETSYNQSDIYDVFNAIGSGLSYIDNRKIQYSEPKRVKKTKPKVSSTTDLLETNNYEEQSHSEDSLPSIIRDVVNKEGPSIILEPRFINILIDLRAFGSSTVHRFILKSIQSEGFGKSLLSINKWELQGENLCQKFISQTGFQQKEAREIFQCLAYGLGYIDSIPTSSNEDSSVPNCSLTHQQHLTIKSIPIDGSITDFIKKIQAKGATIFSGVDPKYTFASVKLTFMRRNDCILYAYCTYLSRTVYKVSVDFPEVDSWWQLYETYYECNDTLTKKYGKTEKFAEGIYLEIEKYKEEYSASKGKRIALECHFKTNAGNIRLYLWGMQVKLEYTDSINDELYDKENKQAAFEDL